MKFYLPNHSYFFWILVSTIFINCTKGPEDPVYDFCLISKVYAQGDTSQTSINFQYDNSDRLVQINFPGPGDPAYIYNVNSVTEGNAVSYTRYYLNSDTTARSSASYNQGNLTDTTTYYYDAEKYLIKAVHFNFVFGKDSSFLTYVDHNLTAIRTYLTNGALIESTFEYNSEIAKAWYYQNIGPYLNTSFYYPWYGKPNKNLIKTFITNFNGNPEPVNMSYSLNSSGYVEIYTQTNSSSSTKYFFEYRCR